MKKKYTYKNAVIYITIPNPKSETIYKATENFLRRLMVETKGETSKWRL